MNIVSKTHLAATIGFLLIAPALWSQTAPLVTAQTSDQNALLGQSVVFNVMVDADPIPSYQWQRLPAGSVTWADINDTADYTGTDTATLTLTAATIGQSGDEFRCQIGNGSGSTTSQAVMLTVLPIAVSTLSGTLSQANGGTGSTTGSILGNGSLTFAAGGTGDQNVTLMAGGAGNVDFGADGKVLASIGQRANGDGLLASFPASGPSGALTIKNPTTGAFAALTEFEFGHTLSFSNSHGELEFHSFNGFSWQPVMTLLGNVGENDIFLRNTSDTNSMYFQYNDIIGHPVITTEVGRLDIELAPGGNLLFTPGGIPAGYLTANQAEGGLELVSLGNDTDIRLAPNGNGRVVYKANTLVVGYLHIGGDIQTGDPAGGQQAPWRLGSPTAAGAVQIDIANVGYNLPAGTAVRQGTAVLSGGTATVNDPAVTANTRVFVGSVSPAGTPGALFVSAKDIGNGFTVTSTSLADNSTISYLEIEP